MAEETGKEQTTLRRMSAVLRGLFADRFGEREANAFVRTIYEDVIGWGPVETAIHADDELSDYMVGKIMKVAERVVGGEPLQYVLGTAHFYGMDFKVTEATLIPRPETATLVDIIVAENQAADLRVIDLGTGSGCIAISLARHLRFASVTAVDFSEPALAVARENGRALRVDVDFRRGDMLGDSFDGPFDIIVSNPPYIAESERKDMERHVLEYEPSTALFVPDGDALRFYRAIARIGRESLAEHGRIYLEINPLFVGELRKMFIAEGYDSVEIQKDFEGRDRFAIVTR